MGNSLLPHQVSSPILRDVKFSYPSGEEVSEASLTSTNFHTYYQGGEMVVAGKAFEAKETVHYEIVAQQSSGLPYRVTGAYNTSQVHRY